MLVLRQRSREGVCHTYLEDHRFLIRVAQAENLAYFMIEGTCYQPMRCDLGRSTGSGSSTHA